jgi:hypothetical protein
MNKEIKNLPASVHDRLNTLSKGAGRPFQEFFYYYAIERFLYRLSISKYAARFVLKGGLMFWGWGIPLRRPTRDIDVQGYLANTVEELVTVVQEICTQIVEPDGMRFDPSSVSGEQIIEAANYAGSRVFFIGYLGQAMVHLHIDVSFANVITPGEIVVEYPSLLGMPAFTIRGYPYETAIAEKTQAMVVLENINGRMKDFYDIWLLSQQVDIPGKILLEALRATFAARKTPFPALLPVALSDDFALLRQLDWERFRKRSLLNGPNFPHFSQVIYTLRQFLGPVLQAAYNRSSWDMAWKAGGPWLPTL